MKQNVALAKEFSNLFQENIEESNLLKFVEERMIEMLQEDSIDFTIYLYFFLSENTKEQIEKDKFWFQKYNSSDCYNEYKFAVDLINAYSSYKKDKLKEKFNVSIEKLVDKFKNYKMISSFVELVKERVDLFEFIVSYLIQDKDYFVSFFKFDLKSIPDNIHNQSFYNKIQINFQNQKIQEMTQIIKEMAQKIEEHDKILKQQSIQYDKKFNEQSSEISELKNNVDELCKRLDKIELQDTITMSFKYLYNVLYFRLTPQSEYKREFWEQLVEIKKILSEPEFNQFNYLLVFINDIEFGIMEHLNTETHSPIKHRKIQNIYKYLQTYCNANLKQVVDFFERMPNINDFINLNIIYYHNPNKADSEFRKNNDYKIIYNKLFETKK